MVPVFDILRREGISRSFITALGQCSLSNARVPLMSRYSVFAAWVAPLRRPCGTGGGRRGEGGRAGECAEETAKAAHGPAQQNRHTCVIGTHKHNRVRGVNE